MKVALFGLLCVALIGCSGSNNSAEFAEILPGVKVLDEIMANKDCSMKLAYVKGNFSELRIVLENSLKEKAVKISSLTPEGDGYRFRYESHGFEYAGHIRPGKDVYSGWDKVGHVSDADVCTVLLVKRKLK